MIEKKQPPAHGKECCGELFAIGFSLDSEYPLSECRRPKGHQPVWAHSVADWKTEDQ